MSEARDQSVEFNIGRANAGKNFDPLYTTLVGLAGLTQIHSDAVSKTQARI